MAVASSCGCVYAVDAGWQANVVPCLVVLLLCMPRLQQLWVKKCQRVKVKP